MNQLFSPPPQSKNQCITGDCHLKRWAGGDSQNSAAHFPVCADAGEGVGDESFAYPEAQVGWLAGSSRDDGRKSAACQVTTPFWSHDMANDFTRRPRILESSPSPRLTYRVFPAQAEGSACVSSHDGSKTVARGASGGFMLSMLFFQPTKKLPTKGKKVHRHGGEDPAAGLPTGSAALGPPAKEQRHGASTKSWRGYAIRLR